eukprot:826918-Rhodomonas_salina.3
MYSESVLYSVHENLWIPSCHENKETLDARRKTGRREPERKPGVDGVNRHHPQNSDDRDLQQRHLHVA